MPGPPVQPRPNPGQLRPVGQREGGVGKQPPGLPMQTGGQGPIVHQSGGQFQGAGQGSIEGMIQSQFLITTDHPGTRRAAGGQYPPPGGVPPVLHRTVIRQQPPPHRLLHGPQQGHPKQLHQSPGAGPVIPRSRSQGQLPQPQAIGRHLQQSLQAQLGHQIDTQGLQGDAAQMRAHRHLQTLAQLRHPQAGMGQTLQQPPVGPGQGQAPQKGRLPGSHL